MTGQSESLACDDVVKFDGATLNCGGCYGRKIDEIDGELLLVLNALFDNVS